jgi:hypothetical protein
MTVDWTQWWKLDDQGRAAMLRAYRECVRRESEANARRWARMTPAARARYPEAAP